ncbi:MAG: acyltransferase [Planctomycetota bacterium]
MRTILRYLGRDVVIGYGAVFSKVEAELADGVYIGQYCSLGKVRIGAETMIADHVCIPSGARQHGMDRLDIPMRQQEGEFQTISIGEDCWIGSHAVILADVGNHCVVASGAVVTRPVPDYAIVAGNPAKPIGDRRDRATVTADDRDAS